MFRVTSIVEVSILFSLLLLFSSFMIFHLTRHKLRWQYIAAALLRNVSPVWLRRPVIVSHHVKTHGRVPRQSPLQLLRYGPRHTPTHHSSKWIQHSSSVTLLRGMLPKSRNPVSRVRRPQQRASRSINSDGRALLSSNSGPRQLLSQRQMLCRRITGMETWTLRYRMFAKILRGSKRNE